LEVLPPEGRADAPELEVLPPEGRADAPELEVLPPEGCADTPPDKRTMDRPGLLSDGLRETGIAFTSGTL